MRKSHKDQKFSGAQCWETRTLRSHREVRGIIPPIDSTTHVKSLFNFGESVDFWMVDDVTCLSNKGLVQFLKSGNKRISMPQILDMINSIWRYPRPCADEPF
jgi:hypothetical protein